MRGSQNLLKGRNFFGLCRYFFFGFCLKHFFLGFEPIIKLVANQEAQERIRILVETSPAAIVTVDERGFIELANRAAAELNGAT